MSGSDCSVGRAGHGRDVQALPQRWWSLLRWHKLVRITVVVAATATAAALGAVPASASPGPPLVHRAAVVHYQGEAVPQATGFAVSLTSSPCTTCSLWDNNFGNDSWPLHAHAHGSILDVSILQHWSAINCTYKTILAVDESPSCQIKLVGTSLCANQSTSGSIWYTYADSCQNQDSEYFWFAAVPGQPTGTYELISVSATNQGATGAYFVLAPRNTTTLGAQVYAKAVVTGSNQTYWLYCRNAVCHPGPAAARLVACRRPNPSSTPTTPS